MLQKKCSKCKEIKDCSLFGKDKRSSDGLRCYCNDCRKIESKIYQQNNQEKRKETLKKYYNNNREQELLRLKKYREENPEKRNNTKQKWVNNNRLEYNSYASNWKKQKRMKDPIFKLLNNLRTRTKDYLFKMNNFSDEKLKSIIGCSADELITHFESQFKEGMSWDNYGFYGWHIDHIIPLSSAKNEEELLKLSHYTNLQPLWMLENIKKGNKII